ncbi:acyl-CoA synthase [Mycolicibacterium pulveris]|uniref:acyl-CoA synthase n=1 Tax=Mycolicibacterium pulveris TaxID=36813 RepID=UPI003CF61FDB
MPSPNPDKPPRRVADDDHDLLTYGEAGVRLHEEIVSQRALVESLKGSEAPELETARRRLQLLEEAAERNFRGKINDDNFERFFGYRGTAKRNT